MDWNNTPVLDSIQLPGSDTKYWMKDTEAREKIEALVSATHFLGVTTTALTDESTTNPIVINGEDVTAVSGDITIYKQADHVSLEFIFDGTYWQLLGGQAIEGAGALAYKDTAEGSYTPDGSVTLGTVEEGNGDIDVVTDVSSDFYIDIVQTWGPDRGSGFPVLTHAFASDVVAVVTSISTSTIAAGTKTDNGSLPTLTGVTVSGLTASINNTTLVLSDARFTVDYSFSSGSFPTYSFASIPAVTNVSTGSVVSTIGTDKSTIYAALRGNLNVTHSGITGTFAGSSATITVS